METQPNHDRISGRKQRRDQRLAAMSPEEREAYEAAEYFKPDRKQRAIMRDMGKETWEEVIQHVGNIYAKRALRADPEYFDTVYTVIEYDKWTAKAQEAYNRSPFNAPRPPFKTVRIVNNSPYVQNLKEEIAEEDRRAKEFRWPSPTEPPQETQQRPLPDPPKKPKDNITGPKTKNLQGSGLRTLQVIGGKKKVNSVRDPQYLQKKLREFRKGMKLSK